jgi:uncharacterized protein (DUF2249 family)
MRLRLLDVSDLEPPEPMLQVLAALTDLADDEALLMRHRREPVPLYAVLAGQGYRHSARVRPSQAHGGEVWEVTIWRADAQRSHEGDPTSASTQLLPEEPNGSHLLDRPRPWNGPPGDVSKP